MTKDEIKQRLRSWIYNDDEKLDDLMADLLGQTDVSTIAELLDEVSDELVERSHSFQE